MDKNVADAVVHDTAAFFSLFNHPIKFQLYLLKNLPAASFSGLRTTKATVSSATVSVPYKWFTRNPFRSTYFACLSMAAELSTGILAMAQLYKRKPRVSMLVTGIEGKFYKKATAKTFFQCNDGQQIAKAVTAAIEQKQSQELKAHSVGRNSAGDVVAEFWITWAFKAK